MTPFLAIPLLVAMLALSSCVPGGKNAAAKVPATPTPPVAATAAKPPAPPPPVSTPQTEIQLPPPQAISAAALATIPSVRVELPAPESTPAAKPPAKTKPPANASTPKPEQPSSTPPAAETPSAVQGPVPPVTTPAEEQPRLAPVYTEEERRRIWGELEKRKTDIEAMLRTMNPNRMSADQKNLVDRIHSFITLAEDTARRGDFRSADALSERAVILAKELASGR
jgi:hypothetical protein